MPSCRVIIVAGGTGTIGSAVCSALVKREKRVIAICRHIPVVDVEFRDKLDFYVQDLKQDHAITCFLEFIRDNKYEIEGLVVSLSGNNSLNDRMIFGQLEMEIGLVEAIVPRMNTGAVVMMSSTAARLPFATGFSRFYSGVKGYVESYVKVASEEFGPKIRINAVAPGIVHSCKNTGTIHSRFKSDRIPMRRMGNTEEVANAVVWTLLDANYMTGQTLTIDGGLTATIPLNVLE